MTVPAQADTVRSDPSFDAPHAMTRRDRPRIKLGYIPLTDCAPLIVAQEKGFFARHGLDVVLRREASWASIRDKVACGTLDGAHMLAGMPLAATLGMHGVKCPMVTALSLDLNGNAITVSIRLHDRMVCADPEAMHHRPVTAEALRRVIEQDRRNGGAPLTFATVFPVSSHHYELRYWLQSAGIDPDRDVRLLVIPPPRMVESLKRGDIDGYCVGEPWNASAVRTDVGRVLITNYELWNNSPEKVLAVREQWAQQRPTTHRSLVRAVLEACIWVDKAEHREAVARLIAGPDRVPVAPETIAMSMTGTFRYGPDEAPAQLPDFNVFHRYAANFPWRSHAVWFLTQMIRAGQLSPGVDVRAVAERVYQPGVYRAVAAQVGVAYPTRDYKPEGRHAGPWALREASAPIEMGPDLFFDGQVFDAERAIEAMRCGPTSRRGAGMGCEDQHAAQGT